MHSRLLIIILLGILIAPTARPKSREELGAYYQAQFQECEVRDGRFKTKVVTRLVILNKRGDRYRWVSVFNEPLARLKKLKATIYNDKGKKVYERKIKDFTKTKGYGLSFVLYDEIEWFQTVCEAPGYPYLIQVEYEHDYSTLFFWRGTSFQESIPVDTCAYNLKVRADLPFAISQSDGIPPPEVWIDGDWKHMTWQATDLPAFKRVAFVPGLNEPAEIKFVAGKLSLEEYELTDLSWDGISAWYRCLAADRYLEGAELSPIGPAPENARETARRIYREIIDNFRYVAVSIGISGWQPAAAKETATCLYGDCKGLSTLLISRLRLAGIPAHPVHVLTRDQGKIDPDFPEFGFNHVIAVAIVGEDTLWMDPTCGGCPFGEVPSADEDIHVLLMTDEGGRVVKTPASRAEDNLVTSRSVVQIQADGDAEIVTEISCWGNRAQELRYVLPLKERGIEKEYYKSLLTTPEETVLISYRYENLTEIEKPFKIYLTTRTVRPLRNFEGCLYTGLPLIPGHFTRMMRDFDYSLPAINLEFPRILVDTVVYIMADSSKPFFLLPDTGRVDSPFATARLTTHDDGNAVMVILERTNNSYRVTSDQFDALTRFCAGVRDLAASAIGVCGTEPLSDAK